MKALLNPPAKTDQQSLAPEIAQAHEQICDERLSPFVRMQAKIYLLYRMAQGHISARTVESIWNYDIPLPEGNPMTARWKSSAMMVRLYIDILHYNRVECALLTVEDEAMIKGHLTGWPPQILNYMNRVVLSEYYRYMIGEKPTKDRLTDIWQFYCQTLGQTPLEKWPYRPTEALGDMRAAQMLTFIFRAAGVLNFGNYDWAEIGGLVTANNMPPFDACIYAIGRINFSRTLWR